MKNKTPKIKPRGQWVLVSPDEPETKNEHGLIIPDAVEREAKAVGTIIEVGSEVKDLKKGQKIIYGVFAGEPIQLGNKAMEKDKVDLILLLSEDVLAILEN